MRRKIMLMTVIVYTCLLYTSDAADERSSVDLGGRRIIKQKNSIDVTISQLHVDEQQISTRKQVIQ